MRKWLRLCAFAFGLSALLLPGFATAGERVLERQAEQVESMILRVKPAVVGILAEVGAEVTVHCGKNETYVVNFRPDTENGTGFIIHPDGWIATNGHVVKSVYRDDDEHIAEFLEAAADTACRPGLAKLPAKQRTARMDAILKDPENRKGVKLNKRLEVFFAKRVAPGTGVPPGVPAVVKAYSPPIDPSTLAKDGVAPSKEKQMLDGAIIKVEMTDLPTVPLATRSTHLHLGQDLFIIGYPGAVLWHDFLSTESRSAPSVTYGRISGFKLDVNERWVIQTDAPISWGNSGGPAFNRDGEVIGLATFITTSLEGDEAIQGFNFLIPVATIQQMAKDIRLMPSVGDPFMQAWEQAVAAYFQGDFERAAERVEAADKLVPGLWDVQRLRVLLKDLEEFQRENMPVRPPQQ
jgi:S1-C subfamily serine protease